MSGILMKSKEQIEHKIGKEPLFSIMDGWNIGIGFCLAFVTCFIVIIPAVTLVLWIILFLFGATLGALFWP